MAVEASAATFTLSPASVSFGTQVVSTTSAPRTVTLTNTGPGILTFEIVVTGDYAAVPACASLAPGASCQISVRFTPTALGSRPGTLRVTDTTDSTNTLQRALSGTGAAETTISAAALAFGSVVQNTSSVPRTFKLTNNQDVPLANIVIASSNADYFVSGCGATLAARANCTASVVFTPTAAPGAAENGTLTITHSAVTSPQTVAMTGTSVFPMTLTLGSLTFASTPQGGGTVLTTLRLRNNLRVPIANLSFVTSGPFSVTGCPTPLAAGVTCTLTSRFAPTSQLGLVNGSVTVSSTDPVAWNRPSAALRGTAIPALSITANPLNLGSVTVAALGATKSVTIKNNLKTAVTFDATTPFAIGGPAAADFSLASETCAATLAAGASCSASFRLRPTQGGTRTATFRVFSDALNSPHTSTLTGVGTTPITLSPSKISFGNVGVGLVSAGKLLTLQNNQSTAVSFNSITVSGEFAKEDTATTTTTCGATLSAGASCAISLVMKPAIGGARTGAVTILSNSSASPNVYPLSGTGTNAVTASPASLSFANQKIGTTSLSKQVTLTNHQTVPAAVGLAVTGNFAATDSCGGTIPARSICVVSVTFSPLAAGARTGILNFNNPGTAALGRVTLSGTGTTADPPAAITSVSPGAGTVGTTVTNVQIAGSYTTFANGAPAVSFGAGVTASNITVLSDTQLVVGTLTINANATPGSRTVQVTNGGTTASLTSGFVVSASAALSFSSITPSTGRQGETLNVSVVGSNTHFQQGITTANFGDGVFVNGAVQVQDSTHATVNVTVSPTTHLGWRAVTVMTGGEYATLAPTGANGPGFHVISGNVSIASASPATGEQGATPFQVTVTGAGTHFLQGASTLSFGSGINVGGIVVDSPTQLRATLAVTAGAAPGLRDVTVTTGGEVASRASAFTVTASDTIPYLSSVSPSGGQQGQTLTLTLTGVNTHFTTDSPSPTLTLGGNITVDSLTVVNDTSIQANISIALNASVGSRQGILNSGSDGHTFTFQVTPSSASIVSVLPVTAPQGIELSITVTGANTHWDQSATTAWFTQGPYCPAAIVNRITVNSPTSAVLDLSIPANACVGPEPFVIATGGEVVGATLGVYRQTPSLSLSPSSGMVGSTVTVNFLGEFSHFAGSGAPTPTTVVIDGTGVAIEDFTVNSPTSATAKFVIAPDAPLGSCYMSQPGCHRVTVTSASGSGSEILTATFQVMSTPAVLTSIEPFHAAPGASALVRIRGSYTSFAAGVTTVGFGPNISTSTPTIVSPTELTVNVTVDSEAALGWRNAYVNTGTEQLTIGFRVDGPASPSVVSVSPAQGAQGQSLTVTITGQNTNFTSSSELILGAGVTVANFTVTNPTTATADVAISPTAPVGPNTVTVLTPIGGGQEVASGAGFSVTRGPSQILSVTPNVATQSQTLNVALVGQGTHWLQGASTADFGPGVVVNALTITDATHANAQITVLSTAPLGFHTVSVQTDGEYVALLQGLNIQDATPALLSSSPNAGQQGTTFNVQVLGRHTRWQQGVTTASYGDGIIVNSFTVIDSISGVMSVTVDPRAYVDFTPNCGHNLTVTTGTEQVTLPGQLCVQQGSAVLTAVNPNSSLQGLTLRVTVTGQNTHFENGLTRADFGSGINVSNVAVQSPTTATVDLAVTSGATNGYRTATMRTLGETASMTFAFLVGAGQPTLNQASPTGAQQGQNVTVRLLGQFTHWTQGTTTVTFGQGVTVTAVSIVNATTADVSIGVDPLAALGSRTVTVTTGGEIVSSSSLFSVVAGPAIIAEISPESGNQGQDVRLTITGQQTHWAQGATQFSMSGLGSDIKLNYFLVNSPTSATAGITINPTATLGSRSIYLATAGEALVHANGFVVTGGIPAVASVNPGNGRRGDTGLNVQISGLYTQWDTTTTVDFGPGVTVQSHTVNSNTSITAVIGIDVGAALGGRTVTVRTGSQALRGHFEVVDPAPPTPYISYMSPWSGLRGQTFTISFVGQHTNWHPVDSTVTFGDPGTSGITINSFEVLSLTSARANITIASGASLGSRTVQIVTGAALEEATFSIVQATPVVNIVDPSSAMQGATLDVNVLGQHTTFDETTTFNFGSGVTVNSITVLGPTVATVNISVAQLAGLGFRPVTATTGSEIAHSTTGTGLSITPSQALIASVTPNTARQRDTVTVNVVGENTHWDGTTTFNFGGGIGITSQTITSATTATLTISLEPLASLGGRTVTATTAGEIASLTNAFVVQEGTPLILSSAPTSGLQQANVTFTILGQFTQWANGSTTVGFDNGITVTSTNVTSPTAITVDAAIEWWAAPGYRTLTVTTGPEVLTLPGAIYVTNGPAAISALNPASGGQGETMSVNVTGVNTHFTPAVTAAMFGPGISVNGVNVTGPTSATVAITIAANATPGQNSVSLTTQGETAGASSAFTIQSTTPKIQFVSPTSAAQGATLSVTVSGQLTNFNATTTFDFGPGVTVNYPAIINSATEATVSITVSVLAPRTLRAVSATTGGVTATGANLFTVTQGPAYISAVSPNSGRQNQNGLQIQISGNQTHFTSGTPSVDLGPGVTVTGQNITSDTLMTVTVNIAQSAPVQLNDVIVTTLGEEARMTGGFAVQTGQPTVTAASPLSAHQNETLDVIVTGLYTNFGASTIASFGDGITINSMAVHGSTQATVNITVQPNAAPGSRNVTMTTGSQVATGTGVFTVLAGQPQLQFVSPNTGPQGSTQTVTITGLYTHFQQAVTTVSFSGGGVTAGTVTVNGPTQLQVPVTVTTGADAGQRTVTVTTGSEVVSLGNAFNVLPGLPAITVISPNVGVPNSTVDVSIAGEFTNFVAGTTQASFGAGIAVNGGGAGNFGPLTVTSPTTATATLQIAAGASLGARNVTVQTGSEVLNVNNGFTVQSTSPTAPTVTRTSPVHDASGVPINTALTIEFSAPVDRNTVNVGNIRITDVVNQYYCWWNYSNTIPGSVAVDASGRVVTFTPAAVLAVGRQYSACINYGQQGTPSGIKDPSGNPVQSTYSYFTTGFAPDNSGPAFIAANIDGASAVATNTPVVLGFTKPINPIAVPEGLTIMTAGMAVPGTFGYTPDYRQVTFTPSGGFAPNTAYVVSYTSALEDSVGNPLSNPASIAFTTGAGADNSAPGLVSRTPVSGGVTGVLPTLRAVFNEPLDPLRVTSANVYMQNAVTGGVVQGSTVTLSADRKTITFVPGLTLDPGTSYNWWITAYDAGGRASSHHASFTTAGAADSTPPAVRSFTPPSGATGVPVNPSLQVVLSEPLDPTFGLSLSINPSVGLTYSTTDNVTLTFTPASLLAPSTTYTLTLSGVRDTSGNAMSEHTWSFTTGASGTGDSSNGTITMVPVNGTTNVASTSQVVFSLSEAVNTTSVNSMSVRLYDNTVGQWLPASIATSTDFQTLTVSATTPFVGGHQICAYVSYYASLFDLAGNPFGYLYNHCFTVGAATDNTPPQVVSVTPFAGAFGIGPYNPITVTFSEPLKISTLNGTNLAVFNGSTLVSSGASVAPDGTSVTFNLGLQYGTTYTVVISSNVMDLTGNNLPATFTSTFTTAAQPITSRPGVQSGGFRPASGATGVNPASPITFFLTQSIDPATVPAALFVSQNGVLITGSTTVTHANRVVTFTPAAPLAGGALVEVWLTSAATDAVLNQLMDFQGSFRVAAETTGAPSIVSYYPAYGGTALSTTVVDVLLSEPVGPDTVTASSFYMKTCGDTPVSTVRSLHNGNRTLRLTAPLAPNTCYYYYITSDVKDVDGLALANTLPEGFAPGVSRSYFTTNTTSDTTAPAVIHAVPGNGATSIGANALIDLTFSELIQVLTVDPTTVSLTAGGSAIPYTFSTTNNADGTMRLRLMPLGALPASTQVTVAVASGVTDFSGNGSMPFSATFTTAAGVNFSPPTVLLSTVNDGDTNVPVTSVFTLTFDRPMNTRSFIVNNSVYLYEYLTGSYRPVTLSFSADLTQVTIAPNSPLGVNRAYYVATCSGADLNGNLASCQTFSFTTALYAPSGGPNVVLTLPHHTAVNVPVNHKPTVKFDRSISRASLSAITLTVNGSPLAYTPSFSTGDTIVTLTPASILQPNVDHVLTISGVKDTGGTVMASPAIVQFRTGPTIDLAVPVLLNRTPPAGSVTGRNPVIRVQYNERIDPIRTTGGTLYNNSNGRYVNGVVSTWSPDGTTMTVSYPGSLDSQTSYQVCSPTAYDLAGNGAGGSCQHFSTGPATDTSPLTVIDVVPPSGSTGIPLNASISIRLNKPADPMSVAPTAIGLTPAAPGSVQLSADGLTLSYVLAANLTPSTAYTIHGSGFSDLQGNAVTPFSSAFTTGAATLTGSGTITLTTPAPGSNSVPVGTEITVTLSRPVNPLSLTSDVLQVWRNNGVRLAGSTAIGAGGTTLTFTPQSPLPSDVAINVYAGYHAFLYDLAGNPFGYLYNATFNTAVVPDTTPPQVLSVSPSGGATSVGPLATVTLIFSESLDPGTIVPANFALFNGFTNLNAGVTRSSDNRIVTLNATLPYGATITVVADTGVTDINGNPLAGTFRSSFTTLPVALSGNPTITQMRPGGGATNVPLNSLLTLYSSHPINAASLASSLAVAQNGVLINGSPVVTSGGRAIVFTPAQPFAPGALIEVFLTTGATDTSGTSFTSFSQAFTTLPDNAGASVQVVDYFPAWGSTQPTNTIIDIDFNKDIDPAYANSTYFHMWDSSNNPVSATVTLVQPRIVRLQPTSILTTGSSYSYRAASGLRALDGTTLGSNFDIFFFTASGPDTLTPAVTKISPNNGAAGIGDNATIRFSFNKLMDTPSINTATVSLESGGNSLPFGLSFSTSNNVTNVTVTPQAPLPSGAAISLTLSDEIIDRAGQSIVEQTTTFQTGTGPDTTRPTIVARSPGSNQPSNVPTNTTTLTWVYSEPLDPTSVTADNHYVYAHSTWWIKLPGSVALSGDGRTVTLTLASNLLASTSYGSCADSTALDWSGNAILGECHNFTTGTSAAATGPQVIATNPVADATGAGTNAQIEIVFDKAVNGTSLGGITLTTAGGSVPFSWTWSSYSSLSGRALQLIPSTLLDPNTAYTVTVGGVQDLAGNVMANPYTFSFTTSQDYLYATTSFTSATVLVSGVQTQLTNGQNINGVSIGSSIQVTFSQPVSAASIANGGGQVQLVSTGVVVPTIVEMSADGRTAILKPQSPLAANTQYRLTVNWNAAVYNQAGYQVSGGGGSFNFTTGAPTIARERIGLANPTTVGFTSRGATGTSVANDGGSGLDAWEVTASDYSSPLTEAEKVAALSRGWRLTGIFRVLSGASPVDVFFGPGRRRFDINLYRNASGDTVVRLNTSVSGVGVVTGPEYTLVGSGSSYHTYELVYDPLTQRATLFVDGVARITGYAGHTDFNDDLGLLFGVGTGTARHHLTRFEIMP